MYPSNVICNISMSKSSITLIPIFILTIGCSANTGITPTASAPIKPAATQVISTPSPTLPPTVTPVPDANATGTAIAEYNIAVDATAKAIQATRAALSTPTRTRQPSTQTPAPKQAPTGAATPTVAPASGRPAPVGSDCPATHPIKGNRGSRNPADWIYHVKGESPNYASVKPEECFATVQDAVVAGYRAPKK